MRFGWDAMPVAHCVTLTTLPAWLSEFLVVDATVGMSDLDWLITPQQRLLGLVAGPVIADDPGALAQAGPLARSDLALAARLPIAPRRARRRLRRPHGRGRGSAPAPR